MRGNTLPPIELEVNMLKKIKIIVILSITISSALYSQITFHGDARVRPRLDQKFDPDGKTFEDFYYMYWVRLWMDAKLTEGWFFTTRLSADGPAGFIGKFGEGTYGGTDGWSDNQAVHGGGRGVVRFTELYFGRKTKNFGYVMGILPFNALANP